MICKVSLVPRLPQFFNVTCRKMREPGKIYHVCDVGVEATWSAARANHDSVVLMAIVELCKIDDLSVTTIALLTRSPSLNVELTWDTFGQMSVLGAISLPECPERSVDQR